MASCSRIQSIPARFRALCVLGAAGLAIAAVTTACVKVEDLTGSKQDGPTKIAISLPAATVPPGSEISVTISATDKNGNAVADGTQLTLKADSLGTVTPDAVALTGGQANARFRAGNSEGVSTITASGAGGKQTATVRISKTAVPPPPATGDAIDITKVRWVGLGGSPADFKVVNGINLRVTSISNPAKPTICWDSNNPSNWPVDTRAGVTVGNLWVLIKYTDGIWYGAPIEWLLRSQGRSACTTMENIPPQPPFIQGKGNPVASYFPTSGERIGFMTTSLPWVFSAPSNHPDERSSIVMATWP